MPGALARLVPSGVTAHEDGHDHPPRQLPPSPLGLGAGPAAPCIRRHPKRRSAAANIDASPTSGARCRPFEAVHDRCQGILGRRQHGSDNRYRHSRTHPRHRPRLPPLKAFGSRPSAPDPDLVQGPASETLNSSGNRDGSGNSTFGFAAPPNPERRVADADPTGKFDPLRKLRRSAMWRGDYDCQRPELPSANPFRGPLPHRHGSAQRT